MEALKTTNKVILIPFLIVLLVSCSSNSTQAPMVKPQDTPTNLDIGIGRDFVFMSDLIKSLNESGIQCINYKKDLTSIGVKEKGDCNYNGKILSISLYNDHKIASQMAEALKQFGGYWITSTYNWYIVTEDEGSARSISTVLGVSVS